MWVRSLLGRGLQSYLSSWGYGWDGYRVLRFSSAAGPVAGLSLWEGGGLSGVSGWSEVLAGERLYFVGYLGDPGVLDRLVGWLDDIVDRQFDVRGPAVER